MKTAIVLSLAVVLAAGCASSEPPTASAPAPATAIPDASLGLSRRTVFEVPTPPGARPNDSAPGERAALPRPYAIAPPRVPHAVDDFLPITRKDNACIDCHAARPGAPGKTSGEPTPMSASHYTDYRNPGGGPRPAVVGARHVCVSCHVATTDAPSLVGNRFRP